MSFVGDFVGDFLGGITGAKQAGEAAQEAGQLQYQAAILGTEEQRRQFDKLVELMSPYVTAGGGALAGQQALIGLQGPEAQRTAISGIETSPEFQALLQQGEGALLQNAAATGGLRGGNIQGALAQFRPSMLSELINRQYSRLGGLSQMGQSAAAGQAASGIGVGENIANLLGQGAAARAGGVLAAGAVPGQTFGNLLQLGGIALGARGF